MARRDSQSTVALNAKIEAVHLRAIETDGAFTPVEGQPIAYSAAGVAEKAVAGDVVFVNFVDPARSDVAFSQNDPFNTDHDSISVQSGGLTGIQGPVDLGLPASAWEGGALPTVGQFVVINASGLFEGVAAPSATGGPAVTYYYGQVYRIDQGRAYFIFTSNPMIAQDDVA